MDLSHWDSIETFSLSEAASLASGVDPNIKNRQPEESAKESLFRRELEAAYAETKIGATYYHEWDVRDPDETEDSLFSRGSLPSIQLAEQAMRWRSNGVTYEMAEDFFDSYPRTRPLYLVCG
jgi:hypothetical protein